MKIAPFKLERYFAKHEFTTEYLLCTSDCQGLEMNWLLGQADEECLGLWGKLTLGYTESSGHLLLRQEIANSYVSLDETNVLVVSGPEEGIFISCNSILEPGDHVITTWPAYQSLYAVAEAIGCEVTKWPLEEKNNWKPDLNFLADSIKDNTKLLVMNFPHNPTGFLPTNQEFEHIVNIAGANGLYVLSDEVYSGLEYDIHRRLSPVAKMLGRKAISISGMSKTFALAGLRIGWIASRDKELLAKIACFKDYTTICSSAPAEILSIIALRAKEKIIQRNLGIIKKNLHLFQVYLSEFKGEVFSWVLPQTGSIFFPKILIRQDVNRFCTDLREKEGVLLLPGSVYDYPGNNFRVGLGRKDFEVGLARLYKYVIQNIVARFARELCSP